MFAVNGSATIAHLNIRKGTSDDALVSVDIKLKVEDVPATAAAAALGADSSADVEAAFFRPVSQDADRNKRFLGLRGISCEATWESKHAITIAGLRKLRASKVGKVELTPRAAGKFDAAFSVSVEQPPEGYIELLAEKLNGTVKVNLEQDADLFDEPQTPAGIPASTTGELPLKTKRPQRPRRAAKKPAGRKPPAKKKKAA